MELEILLDKVMWLFTVPVLKVALQVGVALAALFLLIQIIRWSVQGSTPNPFAKDDRQPRKSYIIDQRKRDDILKQSFSADKVPENLDAIIIGSGIGGMSTGALMAKAGKKVLILEQHDQAGGCCHTFIDKGYEFDVGIHYIGKMGHPNINKTFMDQICDGQVEWKEMEDEFDVVSIGYGEEHRTYPITTGFENWMKLLKKQFPEEEKAIDKFFEIVDEYSGNIMVSVMLKMMPLWLSKLICHTFISRWVNKLWHGGKEKSTLELVQELTDNKDLQTVFCYCWGDYGTVPAESHFGMQSVLLQHYKFGAFYPVGGASEIALNVIPVIERTGGKVLVKADVQEILYNGKKVHGVLVKKGSELYKIEAPLVISSAGLYNTFQRLLPPTLAETSYFSDLCNQLKPAKAAMNVFLGLNASNEELNLKAQNIWAFTTNESGDTFDKYLDMDVEEAMDAKVPLMFISFPSAKDPNWTNHPGRANKSTCVIVTMAKWEWYQKWSENSVKRRGDDYDEIKNTVGEILIEQACQLFPQIRDHIDFKDIGTPVTNKYYLAQPHGELYGLDHTATRMSPWVSAQLRPKTDISGLYLTGQDIMSCGFTGALYAGLLTASSVLGRNCMSDLISLHKRLNHVEKRKKLD